MTCLDANVLIEIILGRKNVAACNEYIASAKDDLAISMLSLDLIMYYAELDKLKLASIQQFLRLFIWLPITDFDAEWAFQHFAGKDFEDALQISCARREGCSKFATLDKSLVRKYSSNFPVQLIA